MNTSSSRIEHATSSILNVLPRAMEGGAIFNCYANKKFPFALPIIFIRKIHTYKFAISCSDTITPLGIWAIYTVLRNQADWTPGGAFWLVSLSPVYEPTSSGTARAQSTSLHKNTRHVVDFQIILFYTQ